MTTPWPEHTVFPAIMLPGALVPGVLVRWRDSDVLWMVLSLDPDREDRVMVVPLQRPTAIVESVDRKDCAIYLSDHPDAALTICAVARALAALDDVDYGPTAPWWGPEDDGIWSLCGPADEGAVFFDEQELVDRNGGTFAPDLKDCGDSDTKALAAAVRGAFLARGTRRPKETSNDI